MNLQNDPDHWAVAKYAVTTMGKKKAAVIYINNETGIVAADVYKRDFTAAGGTALEVVSGANGAQHVDTCAALAVAHGLLGSVGSDFHNSQAAWNPLGRSLKLPDCVTPVWHSFGL